MYVKVLSSLTSRNFLSSWWCKVFEEKAVAPYTSTLAWKIPWMEDPGGLQSMGSRRAGHNWALHFHFLLSCIEKEMATHSRVLAWIIPGMGEPGGFLSMGSHRVSHDWSDLAAAEAACPLSRWCCLTISSSAALFFHLQSFPASGSFARSWLLTSGGCSFGASTSVLPVNDQG